MFGEGFLRRKVTRSISQSSRRVKTYNSNIDAKKHYPPPILYQVCDEQGCEFVDYDYIEIGKREGWLELCGWHYRAMKGKEHLVYRYWLKGQ